jgi:HK97 family phage major capsid protein
MQRKFLAISVIALCAVLMGAQAMGVDVHGFILAHPDVALGLSGLAFMGDTAVLDPAEIKKLLDGIKDQVKEQAEKVLAEAKKGIEMSADAKRQVDELLIKQGELSAQIKEVEQKLAAGTGAGGPQKVKSYGEQLIESKEWKQYVDNGKQGAMRMEVKVVTSTTTGALIRPRYESDVVRLPQRRLRIRDLLTVVPINTSSVDYPKQTTRTNAAAPVAEAAAKPYSDYVWTNATAPVRTIAHLAKLTRQAMDDAPRLVGEVDQEMRYGLSLVEEAQLLSGSGTGQNLSGILTQATAYSAPITIASPTSIDMVRLAMLQASLALFPPDGIVLSEADWARIELTKDSTGSYLFANPQGTIDPRLWGLPVVATPAMAIDAFLVGNFSVGATLYDRMGIEVLISTENSDDFEKNLATMRAEERLALAVKRPAAFVVGDFGLVP